MPVIVKKIMETASETASEIIARQLMCSKIYYTFVC